MLWKYIDDGECDENRERLPPKHTKKKREKKLQILASYSFHPIFFLLVFGGGKIDRLTHSSNSRHQNGLTKFFFAETCKSIRIHRGKEREV